MSSTLDTARAAQDGLVRRMAAILYQDREAIEGAGGAAYARWQQDVRTVADVLARAIPTFDQDAFLTAASVSSYAESEGRHEG